MSELSSTRDESKNAHTALSSNWWSNTTAVVRSAIYYTLHNIFCSDFEDSLNQAEMRVPREQLEAAFAGSAKNGRKKVVQRLRTQ